MNILSLQPRTPAWYHTRNDSWTASTAAVLCVRENAELLRDYAATRGVTLDIQPLLDVGIESYFDNTLWTEWALKTGRIPRKKDNPDMARGRENEGRVLDYFAHKRAFILKRDVTATSLADPWLLASFDAVVPGSSDPLVVAPNGFPVEVKCPAFPSRKKMFDAKKSGKLAIMGLPYYWCQVQHQQLVSKAPYAWFVAVGAELDKDGNFVKLMEDYDIIEQVPRDERFLTAYRAAAKFYHETFIENFEEPPMLPADIKMVEGLAEVASFAKAMAADDPTAAVELYFEALQAEADAKKRVDDLKAKVLEAAAKLRKDGENAVMLADRLEVSWSRGNPTSWQKVAKAMAKRAGLTDVPEDVIAENTTPAKSETVKLTKKEVA